MLASTHAPCIIAVQLQVEKDRMELKNALVAAQESACLQILLEVCLSLPEEKVCGFWFHWVS